jgi:hypothetical protein
MRDNPISSDARRSRRIDEATRQLSGGVYLDRTFRDVVIDQVAFDPDHRVAPSYGFDAVPVCEHALRALALDLSILLCFAGVVAGAAIGSLADALTACCMLAFWWCAGRALSVVPGASQLRAKELGDRLLRRPRLIRETLERENAEQELKVFGTASLVFLAVPVVAAGREGRSFSSVLHAGAWLVGVLAFLAFLGAAAHRWEANRIFAAASTAAKGSNRRLRRVGEQQNSPFVVYRRPATRPDENDDEDSYRWPPEPEDAPDFFVGAGVLVHRWLPPLTVPLVKVAEEEPPQRPTEGTQDQVNLSKGPPAMGMPEWRECGITPFEPDDLIDGLHQAIEDIGGWIDPSSLPGLVVRDRVFVEETLLSNDRACLTGPLDAETRRKIINEPFGTNQHYLEICTTSSGEIVTTVFIRATVKGRTLAFDFAACALTRVEKEFQILEQYGEHGPGSLLRAGSAAVWNLPATVAGARRLLGLPKITVAWIRSRQDRTVMLRRGSAIGTVFSLREEMSVPWRDADHDRPEFLGQMKIIEQRLLKAAESFLDEHSIDTSDFKKRAQTIISANVLNMGGQMDIRGSAIGPNSQAHNQAKTDNRLEGDQS